MTKHGLGPRTLKTALAIFICVGVNNILNLYGYHTVGFYAAISVIMTMQTTLPQTKAVGLQRILGTIIGGVVTVFVFSIQKQLTPDMFQAFYVSITIILGFYLCTQLKMPLGVSTAGIVICSGFTMAPSDALVYFITLRTLETIFGVMVATFINKNIYAPKELHHKGGTDVN